MTGRRIAVIGAGSTGAAAAHHLLDRFGARDLDRVVVFDAADRVGGRIDSTPFAGLPAVDTGADAFLARVPDALDLAERVGLGEELVHPERVGAAVWINTMHDLPDGLVLGVPGNMSALARSSLLSWRGKARAALEPVIARHDVSHDSLGKYVRARFGDEVHEHLVDALIGSIYATDTDNFSLAEVPQLATLAEHRSLLLAARRIARRTAGTGSSAAGPSVAAPRGGMLRLIESTIDAIVERGGEVRLGERVQAERDRTRWRVGDEEFDAVICTTPADQASTIVDDYPAEILDAERTDVVMVTVHVGDDEFPERFRGRSGYLVPKPRQRDITATSFASQKWAHLAPPSGGQILRVSLGREGVPVIELNDAEIVDRVLVDLMRHMRVTFRPLELRITRWPGAFARYRPHHRQRVNTLRRQLPPNVTVAGSSYDGIGIPACVKSARTNAERAMESLMS